MPVPVCEKDFQNFWSRYKNAVTHDKHYLHKKSPEGNDHNKSFKNKKEDIWAP